MKGWLARQACDSIREIREKKFHYDRKKFGKSIKTSKKPEGYSEDTVGLWEAGISLPDSEALYKLADLGEITIDQLLGRKPKTTFQDPSQHEIEEAASQEDKKISDLISKFREQANLSLKRHLVNEINFLLKVKVDE